MNSAVSAPRSSRIRKNRLEATRNASRRSPRSSSSVNTGTKAPCSAESATSARTRFGTWKAIVNADIAPRDAEEARRHDLANQSETRERPVANEKKAVLRARWRACPRRSGASVSMGRALH